MTPGLRGFDSSTEIGGLQQGIKVHAGADTHMFERENQILTGGIAGGSRCERTATKPACRRIKDTHTGFKGSDGVGDP